MLKLEDVDLAIVGLGYVGLPQAVEFGNKMRVLGFYISKTRVDALKSGHDVTREISDDELKSASGLSFCSVPDEIADCNVFIVVVATPLDEHNRPELTPLIKASESIGSVLRKGDIVVYESAVYPGAIEEECIPVLKRVSGLKFNVENAQHDLNIALINELALIFNRMGVGAEAVLEAAGAKWDFLSFRPGLVGGQLIKWGGVDKLIEFRPRKEYMRLLKDAGLEVVFTSGRVSLPAFPSKAVGYFRAAAPVVAYVEDATDFGSILDEEIRGGWSALPKYLSKLVESFDVIYKLLRDELFNVGCSGRKWCLEHLQVRKTSYHLTDDLI